MPEPVPPPLNWRVLSDGPISSLLGERADELFRLGAVYVNRRRLRADELARAGDYVRAHPAPRRFPVEGLRWRILRETPDYVVVDKPPGIPVHATCDNAVENVAEALGRSLGRALFVAHRLDIATQGLLLLAKTREFRARFGQWLQERAVEKAYRALVTRPLAPGEVEHRQGEGRPPYRPAPEGRLCRLRIEEVRPRGESFEVRLTPLTGRHHQIRFQLAALGAPILGDVLYGAEPHYSGERIALQACRLAFPGEPGIEIPSPW